MKDPLGHLCVVLHAHVPYVLNHGGYPHGEAWLYEAAAETYLPLLGVLDHLAANAARPSLTVGFTPVLLEQLAHERFKTGFAQYLVERATRAAFDRREFERDGEEHFAVLARRWEEWYVRQGEHFERVRRDIPGAFARCAAHGQIEVLTSAATHAYLPLLLTDQSIRAQVACGTFTSGRFFHGPRQGMWLPECAYRPAEEGWRAEVLSGEPRRRPGLEFFVAGAGLTHFFVDGHLVANAQPMGTIRRGEFDPYSEALFHWDFKRGWRSPLEPVGVVSEPRAPRCFALARHPRVSEQVWSGTIGYPGSAPYLEFHRKRGEHGLRYHKVTDVSAPLDQKRPYLPDDVASKVYENAQHFCTVVRDVLREHKASTGRRGVCVAAFDAELFGHWWFEGPQFLTDVLLTLHHDPEVELLTAAEALERQPPDKVMRLPEGSWGERGDHRVWINDRTRWMWEVEYRAEERMLAMLRDFPWRERGDIRQVIERAGRQLLLLQSSDWPFVIHSGGAVDYGFQRFAGHATRFDRLAVIATDLSAGRPYTALHRVQVQEADAHDDVFPHINLGWWA